MNNKFFVPQNINRGYHIGAFRVSGIFEGLILGFIAYELVGLIPFPYSAVGLTFQIIFAVIAFFVAARGFFNYTLSEYLLIIFKYWYHRADREYRRAFRLEKALSKTTEDFAQGVVIEQEFGDGMLKLKDGRYVGIVEISPINFFSKTEEERLTIVNELMEKLNVMPVKGQLISYTTSSNPYKYIDYITKCEEKMGNQKLYYEYEDYKNLCRRGIGSQTVEQKFLAVFTSDALEQVYKTEPEKIAALRRCMDDFRHHMNARGKGSSGFVDPHRYKRATEKLLYQLYNPSEVELRPQAFDERVKKVNDTFRVYDKEINTDEIPLSYYLAPMGFDDTASSRYIVVGRDYYSFYYIEQNCYPINGITPGWIAQQFQQPGIDYHLFYQKIMDSDFLTKLNTTANISRKIVNSQEKESQLKSEITGVYEAADYLKTRWEQQDPPYYMGVMISLHASRIQRLYELEDNLRRNLMVKQINLVPCRFLQKEAYLATRLGNSVPKVLWKKMRQNVPASTLAAMYPFASTQFMDNDAIYMGNSNGTPVLLNPFDTKNHDNANIGILGSSGKGKTFTLMSIAERMRLIGREVFIIAPIKGNEYNDFVRILDGNMIRINSSSGQTINIMEIYPPKKHLEDESSLLYKKVENINAFVRYVMPNMSAVESQILNNCIIETYKQFGITKDNETLWEDRARGIKRKVPILGDLVRNVEEYAKNDDTAKDLATVMHAFTEGALSFFNNPTNVDLTNGVTVFDLSGLSSNTKTIAMFAATELIQSYFEEDRTKLKMIIVDEIWMLLENKGSADVVVEWSKTIRGKGGSLCFATQELNDLYRAQNGVTLVSQAETRILLGMRSNDLDITNKILTLTKPVQDAILDRPRGGGVIITRDNSVKIDMLGSGHNMLWYATDPNIVQIREDLRTKEEVKLVEGLLADGKEKDEIWEKLDKLRQMNKEKKAQAKREQEMAAQPVEKPQPRPTQVVKPERRQQQAPIVKPQARPQVVKPQARPSQPVIKPENRNNAPVIKPARRVMPENDKEEN